MRGHLRHNELMRSLTFLILIAGFSLVVLLQGTAAAAHDDGDRRGQVVAVSGNDPGPAIHRLNSRVGDRILPKAPIRLAHCQVAMRTGERDAGHEFRNILQGPLPTLQSQHIRMQV